MQKFYSIGPKQNAFPEEPNLKMKNCSRFKSKAWKKFFCVKLIPLHFEMFFQLSIVCDNNSSSLLCPALSWTLQEFSNFWKMVSRRPSYSVRKAPNEADKEKTLYLTPEQTTSLLFQN